MDCDTDGSVVEEAMSLALHLAGRCGERDAVAWLLLCGDVCAGGRVTSTIFSQATDGYLAHTKRAARHDEEDGEDDHNDETRPPPPSPVGDDAPVKAARWRTKHCALACLLTAFGSFPASEAQHHFDLSLARACPNGEAQCLVSHLAQVVSIAFSAITSRPVLLRLAGVQLLEQVVTLFGPGADPDCDGALLLGQCEAQIISALRTALRREEHPTVAVAACNVCWEFLSFPRPPNHDAPGDAEVRVVTLLLDQVEDNVHGRKGFYSDLAYTSVQANPPKL